jgi:hypothetical protein
VSGNRITPIFSAQSQSDVEKVPLNCKIDAWILLRKFLSYPDQCDT